MDFPSAIQHICPNCDHETLHKVLKGKLGNNKLLSLDCTIKCTECNFIHHTIITEKKMIEIPIIISNQDKSFQEKVELHPDEELKMDQELFLDEKSIKITSLEVNNKRVEMAFAKNVKTIWGKLLDQSGKVRLNVSIHKGPTTMSHVISALPDEEFFIGDILKIGRDNVAIYRIKTKSKVVKYDSALAGDIVRVYGRVIR